MEKHTPGPWHIDYDPIDPGTDIRSKDGTMLAQVCGHGKHIKEKEANARLISAAPDLLAALYDICETEDAVWCREKAWKAIAKAIGLNAPK